MERFVHGCRQAYRRVTSFRPVARAVVFAILIIAALAAHAQSGGEEYDEFGRRLRAAQEVAPLKSDLFGDQVSLYNGSTEFNVVDIDIPGNNALPVRLNRRFVIEDPHNSSGTLGGLGDWDLDVPYIDGSFTQEDGWTVRGTNPLTQSYARCSLPNPPYTKLASMGIEAPVDLVWDGNEMHIPGEATEELLKNTEAKLPAVADGKIYPWITKGFYRASCLSNAAGGYPGEAFAVVSPSGVRYNFNWAVVHPMVGLNNPTVGPNGQTTSLQVPRSRIFLVATEVDDRFGNWVKYNYSGDHLTSITSNDGREIDISWSGNAVQTAKVIDSVYGSRTWTYSYASDGRLNSVTQPDGSKWTYTVVSGSLGTTRERPDHEPLPDPPPHCQKDPTQTTGAFVYQVGAPSGAIGTFNFDFVRHRRTYVPLSCTLPYSPNTAYPSVHTSFENFTLVSKQITGAGLSPQAWKFDYEQVVGIYFTSTAPGPDDLINETYIPQGDCPACAVSKVVTVKGPGDIVKYTFGVQYARNEGLLLQTETDSLSGSVKKTETYTYLSEGQVAAQNFPDNAGRPVQRLYKNPMIGRLRPLVATTIVQDGDTYTRQIRAFDVFVHPTQVKRFNNIAGQQAIEERTTYLNNLPHWVLGLVQRVDNVATDENESLNGYDISNATLTSRSEFGLTQRTYTYTPQGQVATAADGKGNTIRVSNYQRGIPQTIQYPDGYNQTLVVDDFGGVRSVKDQAGNLTSYDYDALGRVSKITYPAADEQAWLPRTFTHTVVGTSERGLSGTHWRRTSTKGDSNEVTYFDAMLRPVLTDTYMANVGSSHVSVENTYDWKGRKTFGAYAVAGSPNLGATAGVRSIYDELDRLIETDQTAENGTTLVTKMAYPSGGQMKVTDPKGNATITSYQVFDEPSYDAVIQIQAPEGVNQSVARDVYGNPTAIRQSGVYGGTQGVDITKTLIYDAQHRLCRSVEPESRSEVVAYDNASNVSWRASGLSFSDNTSCNQSAVATAAKTQYAYDAMNRVQQITPPTGTQGTIYGFDPLGNVNSAISGITIWSAHRNKLGMITDETLSVTGNGSNTLRYGHDIYGAVKTITYPDSTVLDYAPDALGRPTKAGVYATGVGYYPDGAIQYFTYGNGANYVAEENARQLLSNFTYGKVGSLNISEDVLYDANGNITKVNDLVGGARTKTFGYDGLNRLTQAQANGLWGTESYAYDPVNNIRSRIAGAQTFTYNYDAANLLTSIKSGGSTINSFLYDPRGNVINKNGNTLVFDAANQLLQIPGYSSYAYDAAGRRVQKASASGSGLIFYFYTQAGQLLYQYDASTTKSTDYIYLGKKLIARNEAVQFMPPASINISASPNDGDYTISWTAVSGATSYRLQENASGGGWVSTYSGGVLSLVMTNKDGGSYAYRVQACNASICTDWTNSSTLGVTPALPTITVPSGTINGTYTVSWTTPAGATTFDVQESFNSDAWTSIASNTTATSASRSGTATGSYSYRVQAKNSYGTRGWSTSSAVKVDTTYGVVPPASACVSVAATSATGNVTVSWSTVAHVTHYIAQQSSDNGSTWISVYNGAGTSTALSGLANGSYVYQVQACNDYNCGPWARSGTLVVAKPPTNAPTLSVPGSNGNGSYTVNWSGIPGEVSYTLQEQVNGGGWTTVQSNGMTSWNTSGRGNGTYGYHAQACNAGGCGPWSIVASLIVLLPSAAPASINVPATSNGPVTVTWAVSSTASSYSVFQSFNGGGWSSVYNGAATSTSINEDATGSYAFEVQACNSGGCSAFKTSSAVAVTIPPSGTPSLSVPATSKNGSYSVSWTAVGAASSYTLQERLNSGGWTTVQANGSTSWAVTSKTDGTYGYQVQACNAGGCGPWSAMGSVGVTLDMPIGMNGQSYLIYYAIPQGANSSVSIGFDIINSNTWEVFTTKPGVGYGHVLAASGAIPWGAVTVQYTWIDLGVPGGALNAGGTLTNTAASPVAVSSNPFSQYMTLAYGYKSEWRAHTYQLRVDFFNAAGSNISSSTCTLSAQLMGTI